MQAKDILVAGLLAALTAGAANLVWPTGSVASADSPALLAQRQDAPAIEHEGAVFKLVCEGDRFQAGQRPTYRLQVTDLTGQARRIPVRLELASLFPTSPMSRVVALPQKRWQDELMVAVVPGRTRSIRIQPGVALDAGQQVILTLRVGAEQPRATRLVLAPEAQAGRGISQLAGLQLKRPNG